VSAVRLAVALILVTTTALLANAARQQAIGVPEVFDIPYTVEGWKGVDAAPFDEASEQTVAADLVLNRTYSAADGGELGLYLAYYAQQRPGVGIHSPLHCLPGTGWDVLSSDTVAVDLPGGRIGPIRRLVAQKAAARVLVMYWYSIHGRMIASEAASRWQLLNDRVRLGRNDGALVRLVVPVIDSDAVAERRGVGFARSLVPYLESRE
jgi:EpsI family protein